MAEKRPTWAEIERDRDEPVELPLDPDVALRALLKVEPELANGSSTTDADGESDHRD